MNDRSQTTIKLAFAFFVYIATALYIDIRTHTDTQWIIGLTTWIFLAGAIRLSPPEERIQVFVMIGVATFFESICSLVWGLYVYRLDNLPLYVLAGHGLFYLMALRVSELPFLRRHVRVIVASVIAGTTVHLLYNIGIAPRIDQVGLVCSLIFLPFIIRNRFALLYAVSFTMTMGLEFYGTTLGNWSWTPVAPFLGLAAANPPVAIGVGYCIMDGITRLLSPKVLRLVKRRKGLTPVQPAIAD